MSMIVAWSLSTIKGLASAWRRLTAFAAPSLEGAYSGTQIRDFLRFVDARARELAAERSAKKPKLPPPAPGDFSPQPRGGATAMATCLASLGTLENTFGISLYTKDPVVGSLEVAPRPDARPAAPFDPWLVARFHQLALDKSLNIFTQAFAAALVLISLGCLRVAQAQRLDLQQINTLLRIICAITNRDKHPKRSKQRPRPVWIPLDGVMGGDGWLQPLLLSKAGMEDGCFTFRRHNGTASDPERATAWQAQGMSSSEILASLRIVLKRHCGLSAEEARAFGCGSAREFLPSVAAARGLSALDCNEVQPQLLPRPSCGWAIGRGLGRSRLRSTDWLGRPSRQLGRWSGAVAQELNPLQRALGRAELQASPMPDRYAQQPRVLHVIELMKAQVSAVRELVARVGVASMARGFGGL